MRLIRTRFWARLGLVAILALALRAVYVLVFAPVPARAADDSFWFAFVSQQIASGHGFTIAQARIATRIA